MKVRKYGLLGYPLKHSFSAGYFSNKFEKEGITDATYSNFEEADLHLFLSQAAKMEDLKGFNITIPYKEGIMPLIDFNSDEASWIGAVNTVKIKAGKLYGYNTDVIGFRESIAPLLKNHHRKALILGSGGASKAVKYVFNQMSIASVVVSRFSFRGQIVYDQISETMLKNYTVIINTTPLGTFPDVDNAPKIPYEHLTDEHLCFDLVYNPEKTKFLQLAEEQGATIKNGHEMLELQAEASWKIWNNEDL